MKLLAGSRLTTFFAAFCSLLIALLVFTGHVYLRGKHARQVSDLQSALKSTPVPTQPPAQVTIYENEPTLKGSIAVLSGTILNKSGQEIADLSVELQLIPRQKETPSTRFVSVKPGILPPLATGDYRLEVSSRAYSGARVLRLVTTGQQQEMVAVAFAIETGTRRRKEPPPGASSSPAGRKRPSDNDNFLNSPDNPVGLN